MGKKGHDITYPIAMSPSAAFDTGSSRGGFSFRETGPDAGAQSLSKLQGVSVAAPAIAKRVPLEWGRGMRETAASMAERASVRRPMAALFSFCSRSMALRDSACKMDRFPDAASD